VKREPLLRIREKRYSSEFSQGDLGCGTLGNMQMDVGRIQEGILWIQPEQVQVGQVRGVTIGFY
jgi:hypothetical protein